MPCEGCTGCTCGRRSSIFEQPDSAVIIGHLSKEVVVQRMEGGPSMDEKYAPHDLSKYFIESGYGGLMESGYRGALEFASGHGTGTGWAEDYEAKATMPTYGERQ